MFKSYKDCYIVAVMDINTIQLGVFKSEGVEILYSFTKMGDGSTEPNWYFQTEEQAMKYIDENGGKYPPPGLYKADGSFKRL